MSDRLSDLLVEVAGEGCCVKVGNWCCALVSGDPQRPRLIPPDPRYHAEITAVAGPNPLGPGFKWGETWQGWGDDPLAALFEAREKQQCGASSGATERALP